MENLLSITVYWGAKYLHYNSYVAPVIGDQIPTVQFTNMEYPALFVVVSRLVSIGSPNSLILEIEPKYPNLIKLLESETPTAAIA